MMDGRWGGTMCLTEPGAGSDVGALVTTATPKGNGLYAIKGIKIFISAGESDLYDNLIHLVLARTPNAPQGIKGISLFIVPRIRIDGSQQTNNVKCTKIEEKMGIHGSPTCELTFGQTGECLGTLLGKEGEGINNMFIMMNEARIMCATQGESQALLAYQMSEHYAQERIQFQQPIIQHPDVARMLYKMRAISRGLRALLLYTSNIMEGVRHLPPEQAKNLHNEVELLTPICKAYATEKGVDVALDAIQVHGGYGFCTEYGVEQFVRDMKIATIYEGTNGIQAKDFTMRKILRDKGGTLLLFLEKIEKSLETFTAVENQTFKQEKTMILRYAQQTRDILEKFWPQVTQKQFEELLFKSYDFLFYMGHLTVAWRLLEAARVALPFKEEKEGFFRSKLTDVKIFCQLILQQNESLGAFILGEMSPLKDLS
jgi:alkylation response protein AidB-like acyl-CoA dehydrogenase